MRTMSDRELRAVCFNALVKQIGYLDTERFIVMMNRDPEDYTAWRERQPDFEGSIEELGAKIMAFSERQQQVVSVQDFRKGSSNVPPLWRGYSIRT